ncbi:hypothetical protein Tco_0962510 [Tanacetum coccineum]
MLSASSLPPFMVCSVVGRFVARDIWAENDGDILLRSISLEIVFFDCYNDADIDYEAVMNLKRFVKAMIVRVLARDGTVERIDRYEMYMDCETSWLGSVRIVTDGSGVFVLRSISLEIVFFDCYNDVNIDYEAVMNLKRFAAVANVSRFSDSQPIFPHTKAVVPTEVKGKNKGGKGKKKAATNLDEAVKLAQSISKTKAEEEEEERRLHDTQARLVIRSEANPEADTAESEETMDDEVQPPIRRSTGVVIGREVPMKSAKGALDDFDKLKRIEILSEAALHESDIKQASKASKQDYRIQQHSIGSSEGAGIIPEVPDEPKDISSSSSSSSSDDETEIISLDDENKADDQEKVANEEKVDEEMKDAEKAKSKKAEEEHADEEKAKEEKIEEENVDDEQARVDQAQDNQAGFLNVSFDTSLVGILKDPTTKLEIQSIVDVPIHQEDPTVQQTLLVDTVISMLEQRFSELKKKVKAMSKINQAKAIKESIQANLINEVKNQLPKLLAKALSDFVNLRLESTLKNMLCDKMQQSGSFQEHHKHIDLYNALIGSIGLDEAIAKSEIDLAKILKKRHRDDKNNDPPANSDKERRG